HDRGTLSSARGAGGGRAAARSLLRRAKADSRALQGTVLRLRGRRGGAPLQPAADRRRPDQGALRTTAASLPGLTRQSIQFDKLFFRWMPGSSPSMTSGRQRRLVLIRLEYT